MLNVERKALNISQWNVQLALFVHQSVLDYVFSTHTVFILDAAVTNDYTFYILKEQKCLILQFCGSKVTAVGALSIKHVCALQIQTQDQKWPECGTRASAVMQACAHRNESSWLLKKPTNKQKQSSTEVAAYAEIP